MAEIIKRLPTDLINRIIPYTYNPQSKELLEDIHSYFTTKQIISEIFYKRYEYLFAYEKDADMNWLVSDILCFMNHNRSTFYRYSEKLYEIYARNYMLRNVDRSIIKKIANNAYNKNIHFQFRINWGLLLPEERENFIKIQKKIRY